MSKWPITLSTTEPYNSVGLIKVRQGNAQESFRTEIVANNVTYNLLGLETPRVMFVTEIKNGGEHDDYLLVQKEAVITDLRQSIVEFTLDDDCMQKTGRRKAYFEIYDGETLLDTTQDFEYTVIPSIWKRLIDGSSYIQRLEDLLDRFLEWISDGQNAFDSWWEKIKGVLGDDPAGQLALELVKVIDAIGDISIFRNFETNIMVKMMNAFNETGFNVQSFGAKGDGITDDSDVFNEVLAFKSVTRLKIIVPDGKYLLRKKLSIPRNVEFIGVGRPMFFLDNENDGLVFDGTYTRFSNIDVFSNHAEKKGIGLSLVGGDGGAYCKLDNLRIRGFETNLRITDSFEVELNQIVSDQCQTAFSLENVRTMLNIQNCFASDCQLGWRIKSATYSTLINIACDRSEIPYLFEDCHGVTVTSIGMEDCTMPMHIGSSELLIQSLVSVRNKVSAAYPQSIVIETGSKVVINTMIEESAHTESSATSSISLDATAKLSIDNSRLLKPIYFVPGGRLDGYYRSSGEEYYYERSNRYFYGTSPSTSNQTHKIGEKMFNPQPAPKSPAIYWVCVAAGKPGAWRATFIPIEGALADKPKISGYDYFGLKYMVTVGVSMPYEITWIGNRWIKSDGTTVS